MFGVAHRTVYRWLEELGEQAAAETIDAKEEKEKGKVRRKRKFSESFKFSVLEAYSMAGPAAAATQFGVTAGLVMQWRRAAGVPVYGRGGAAHQEVKNEAKDVKDEDKDVNDEDKDVKDEAKDVEDEAKDVKDEAPGRKRGSRPTYSRDVQAAALEHYALHGLQSTLATFHLRANSVHRWRRAAGLADRTSERRRAEEIAVARLKEELGGAEMPETVRSYDAQFREEVVAHYRAHGQASACRRLGVASATVYQWLHGGTASHSKSRYSPDTRRRALALATSHGARAAASSLDLPHSLVSRWLAEHAGRLARSEAQQGGVEQGELKIETFQERLGAL